MNRRKLNKTLFFVVVALILTSSAFAQNSDLDSLKLLFSKENNKKIKSHLSLQIGEIYFTQSNLLEAQDYFHKGLKLSEEAADKKGEAAALNNIGIIYNKNGNLAKCIELLERSLKLKLEIKDAAGLGNAYNNLGFFYHLKGNTLKALDYCQKALKILQEIGDKEGEGYTLLNLGNQYKSIGEYSKAKEYYTRSLKLREEIQSKPGIAECLAGLGRLAYDQKDFGNALKLAGQSFRLSKELGFPGHIRNSAELLYKIYKEKGNKAEALNMHELYTQIKDSINSEKNRKSFLQKEFQLAYEKKAASDSIKTIKEKRTEEIKHVQEVSKQRTYTYAGIIAFALMLIVAVISFKAFHQKKKDNLLISQQKKMVESKQKEIIDSINYAKKIQDTLLVHTDILSNELGDHFILFKPKDIVSGDFYWATKIVRGSKIQVQSSDFAKRQSEAASLNSSIGAGSVTPGEELFYLAVCDSTGHGVPGAFMSLLNISFLNEAINEKNIFEPHKILEYVRQRLIGSVSRDGQQDGFDGILLCFDKLHKTITYSSANNRPLIIQNNKLLNMPYDKMPVGKGDKGESFTLYTGGLKKGDSIYLYTDGFADQFGGPKGKKFKSKKLEELLYSTSQFPISSQRNILNQKFEEWKGDLEQVDDVCIVGIKI